jgi:Tfp pilus assembly protein PilW
MICVAARHRVTAFVGGLTLIELLVALMLGVILSAGMVSAYLNAKRTLLYEDQIARIQENGRYSIRLLSRELAMAGFLGGLPAVARPEVARVGTDCSVGDWALDSRMPLDMVTDYSDTSPPVSQGLNTLTCVDPDAIALGTDLIIIKRTAAAASMDSGVPGAKFNSSTVLRWYLQVESGNRGEWVQLKPADLFSPTHAESSLSYWEAVSRVFFVRAYANEPGDRIPTLCMETLAGNAMTSRCLVEGIENLQLEFGIDQDDDGIPNQYLAEPSAAELRQAITVRVHLLMRSINELTGHTDDNSYRLGQKRVAPTGDAYIRRVVSTTVLLRNLPASAG